MNLTIILIKNCPIILTLSITKLQSIAKSKVTYVTQDPFKVRFKV